jgi:protein-S-isoprenylcysteine O-methyltransferase Ste14
MIWFVARPVTVLGLAASNRGTLSIPFWLGLLISVTFLGLTIYLFYSVIRFFGLRRALGIDHFRPEEYRNKPLVQEGIYRWTSNGMYIFGFLLLWIPGLLFLSKAALLAAIFNHLYIWVHYYFTEVPDMKFIYGDYMDIK